MNNNTVLLKIDHRIAIITLNNPEKHNVLNSEMISELSQMYHACENNTAVDVIMLHAHGKHFCAGADLKYMLLMGNETTDNNFQDARRFAQLFYQIYSCKKPTIACGHGSIRGGGIGLLAAHDFAIVATESTFCFSEVTIGLVPAIISPYVLQRMPYQHAKYFMMSADIFDAQKALETRLIDHCCDLNSLIKFSFSRAQSLCKNNLPAMIATKKWLQKLNGVTSGITEESAALLTTMRSSDDAKNLMKKFLGCEDP